MAQSDTSNFVIWVKWAF